MRLSTSSTSIGEAARQNHFPPARACYRPPRSGKVPRERPANSARYGQLCRIDKTLTVPEPAVSRSLMTYSQRERIFERLRVFCRVISDKSELWGCLSPECSINPRWTTLLAFDSRCCATVRAVLGLASGGRPSGIRPGIAGRVRGRDCARRAIRSVAGPSRNSGH